MRLIDADALVSALNNGRLKEQTGRAVPFNAGVAFALTMVEYAPTIDVAPVRHGRLVDAGISASGHRLTMCTICKRKMREGIEIGIVSRYCPNCGVRLDEEVEK